MSDLLSAVDQTLAELEKRRRLASYRDDPVLWAKERLGKHLWSKQQEVAYSVRDNRRTAVRSCNNAGKTAVAGVIGAWFIDTNEPHETIVVCTAPAFPQIRTNLFHEFAVDMRAAEELGLPLPGYLAVGTNLAEWKLRDGTQLALGRRPPDKDAITSLQGIHRKNILVIIDESGGVPPDLFVAAERITTTGNARILAIGNPDRPMSEFHKMFSEKSDWHQIHISGYDTPLFTGEYLPEEVKPFMLQPEWVERQKRVWGENDPRFKISILGEFPDTDDTIFFPANIVNRAIDLDLPDDEDIPIEMGVDLARYGDDRSVIYTNRGGRLRKYKEWSKSNALESMNIVHQSALELGCKTVKIDAGGIGGPMIDILKTMTAGMYTIYELNGGGAPWDRRRHINSRAAWYDYFRERMALDELDLDENDTELIEEMADINFELTEPGQIKIESKKDLRSRSGSSPDHLDAAIYAMVPVNAGALAAYQPGDKLRYDANDILGDDMPAYLDLMVDLYKSY